jgi:cell division protein FtsN
MLVILGLTFVLGLLVGRQWAHQSASAAPAPSVSEAARRAAAPPPARRGGIAADIMADRAPESTEKLTFYQTLTEPLDGPGAPRPESKPVTVRAPAAAPAAPAPAPPAPASSAPAVVALPPIAGKAAAPISSVPSPSAWTIQVGAYKTRRQADDLRRHLAASGLDAYVASVAAKTGQARFRVRVGAYRTREEAAAAAERIRAERSLTTFVTPK